MSNLPNPKKYCKLKFDIDLIETWYEHENMLHCQGFDSIGTQRTLHICCIVLDLPVAVVFFHETCRTQV
uniref:Uncharacterized protein n=1 Tax=Aegilops tauschii subsp. strangulata TaxID=200361 RepID=A0A453S5Z4_AEGTS